MSELHDEHLSNQGDEYQHVRDVELLLHKLHEYVESELDVHNRIQEMIHKRLCKLGPEHKHRHCLDWLRLIQHEL